MFGALCALVLLRLLVWKFFPTFEPFIKEDISNLICAAAILVVAAFFYGRKAVLGAPLQEKRTGLELVLGAYLAASALSLVISVDRVATTRYVIVLFSYVVFFFMLAETLDDHVRRRAFLIFFLAMALLVAGWGIRDYIYLIQRPPDPSDANLQKTNDSLYYILMRKRACSFFGWPNVLAGFLGLAIPVGLSAVATWRSIWAKLAAAVYVVVMLAGLFFTFSFLGWLSFLIGFFAAAVVFLWGRQPTGRGVKIAMGIFALTAVALFAIVVWKKDFATAIDPRREYLNESLRGIADHPFLGTGLDTFRYASAKYATLRDGLTAFAHNSYLQVWVESGLLGFLAILAVAFVVLKTLYARARRVGDGISERVMAAAFVWAFAAFFVDNLWSFTVIKPNISLFFWVVLGYVFAANTVLPQGKALPEWLRRAAGWTTVLVIVVAMGFAARGIAAQTFAQQAVVAEARGKLVDMVQLFQRARKIDPKDARIAFEFSKRYVSRYQQTGDVRLLAAAEEELLDSVDNSPLYASRLMLGLVYRAKGRMAEARDLIREAQTVGAYETNRDLAMLGLSP